VSVKKRAANKRGCITLDHKLLFTQGIKYLRTLYYTLAYRGGFRAARKNSKRDHEATPRKGFYAVSASFVKAVTGIDKNEKTLLKHLNRGCDYGLCDSYNQYDIIYRARSLKECLTVMCQLKEERVFWKKIEFANSTCVNTLYYLYKYTSNLVRVNI